MFGEFLCTNTNSAITVSLQVFLAEKRGKIYEINYRSVSIPSKLSNIFEKGMFAQMSAFLKTFF